MSKVSLKNIKKIYNTDVVAVEDFNLEIEDKEFIVLVGPSGCGKTTTLRMIAGLEDITEGEIYIGDELVNNKHPKDRDIAMVFQNYALYPHMSVQQNMAFSLKLRKMKKEDINSRVKNAASILEIENLLDRKPKELSGGQKQRVALGRAMVREPKVFLMDEPLSNLDAKLRVQMRTEIAKLHKNLNGTFIYVTHDQTEAMTMGTRLVIMKDGNIQQVGAPQFVYDNPANVFVASFIGSPQMNILQGKVIDSKGKIAVELLNGNIINLSDEKEECLAKGGFIGQNILIGIRPENLHEIEVDPLKTKYSTLTSVVDVAELMGSETYLYMSLLDEKIIAKVDPKTKKRAGDYIELRVHWNRIHLFDKKSKKTITK